MKGTLCDLKVETKAIRLRLTTLSADGHTSYPKKQPNPLPLHTQRVGLKIFLQVELPVTSDTAHAEQIGTISLTSMKLSGKHLPVNFLMNQTIDILPVLCPLRL
ncbi:hypothetical protein Runsl_5005 [Runella slithyformis DSM 19594]|uniref:Uncharacterized protein n=1 Tax=Runella slithyformis (strain ATCC 29530 / DSM 19594 / LMG 11500 / NCIMB 11436 / LSU 4) TaxID=761193 RepID=A0A7U4E8J6_RUNSL|nr:hypothetical protein [Runella slithyformis]AEI51314.1 hypothetical protein Runsl_5005 [Runella slithyformis DSM 19594]